MKERMDKIGGGSTIFNSEFSECLIIIKLLMAEMFVFLTRTTPCFYKKDLDNKYFFLEVE